MRSVKEFMTLAVAPAPRGGDPELPMPIMNYIAAGEDAFNKETYHPTPPLSLNAGWLTGLADLLVLPLGRRRHAGLYLWHWGRVGCHSRSHNT